MLSSSEIDELVAAGRALHREGRNLEALYYFERLATEYPTEARLQYELAAARDGQGMEREAIAAYRKAIQLGLEGGALAGAMLGLGSALRNVGEYEDAVAALTSACNHFPDFAPLRAFLALALYSAGRADEATVMLLKFMASAGSGLDLQGYETIIHDYASQMRPYLASGMVDLNNLPDEQTIQ